MSGRERCVVGIVSQGARPSYRVFCRIGIGDAVYRELIDEVEGHIGLAPMLADHGIIRIRPSPDGYTPVGLGGCQRSFYWRLGRGAHPHAVRAAEVPWEIADGALLLEPPDRVLEVFRALHPPVDKEARR